MPTMIHERVRMARAGTNPYVIAKLASGWVVIGDVQPLPGYCLLWAAPMRGQGYGATLFCQSALEFYQLFQLKEIVCEPRAANPLPNRMLQKIGFPLLRTHVAASSELSEVCELNCYEISKDLARAWLEKNRALVS